MKWMICSLLLASVAFGQLPDEDEAGCSDSKVLTRMRGCKINSCVKKEFDSAEVMTTKSADGFTGKALEGAVEEIIYVCPANISQLQIVRNAESALKAAGFGGLLIGESGGERYLTMRKGSQWVGIHTDQANEFSRYTKTAVLVKAMTQEMEATAEGLGSEIDASGRVAVYGIQFETGKSAIKPESEAVLGEIVKLLQGRTDLRILVEGHTDNVGAKAANLALSGQRANSVIAWLVAHGIDKGRLTAQGFGDSKPIADNGAEEGRAKNRRVELVKR